MIEVLLVIRLIMALLPITSKEVRLVTAQWTALFLLLVETTPLILPPLMKRLMTLAKDLEKAKILM
jgi:hypothetical protein